MPLHPINYSKAASPVTDLLLVPPKGVKWQESAALEARNWVTRSKSPTDIMYFGWRLKEYTGGCFYTPGWCKEYPRRHEQMKVNAAKSDVVVSVDSIQSVFLVAIKVTRRYSVAKGHELYIGHSPESPPHRKPSLQHSRKPSLSAVDLHRHTQKSLFGSFHVLVRKKNPETWV